MFAGHELRMNFFCLEVNVLSMKCDFQECRVIFIFKLFYTSHRPAPSFGADSVGLHVYFENAVLFGPTLRFRAIQPLL